MVHLACRWGWEASTSLEFLTIWGSENIKLYCCATVLMWVPLKKQSVTQVELLFFLPPSFPIPEDAGGTGFLVDIFRIRES